MLLFSSQSPYIKGDSKLIYYQKIGPLMSLHSLRLYTVVVFPTREIESDQREVLSITRGPDIEEISIRRHVMKLEDIKGEECPPAKLLADISMVSNSVMALIS